MNATACPDPGRLQELIDGGLPEPEQAELTGHLDSCECCQQRLETIAAGGSPAAHCLHHCDRDRPAGDSAFWPAFRSLEAAADTLAEREPPGEVRLDFLDPPTSPGALGRLGHFDVVEVIGRGGMGIVLKAFDT